MEPRSLAYQSGTLTITPNCFLCLCEVIVEPYSCLGDSVQFIEFNENLFILEKLEYMVADICCMTKCWLYFNSFSLLAGQHCVTISSFPSSNIDGSSKNSPGLSRVHEGNVFSPVCLFTRRWRRESLCDHTWTYSNYPFQALSHTLFQPRSLCTSYFYWQTGGWSSTESHSCLWLCLLYSLWDIFYRIGLMDWTNNGTFIRRGYI